MPLTPSIIDEACERYFRERDRYVKLAAAVEERARRIVGQLGVRATLQSRAKGVDSLRGKLLRWQQTGSKDSVIHNAADVFEVVGDLAAVRVLPYIEADRERIVQRIVSEFVNEQGSAVGSAPGDIEVKPDPAGNFGKSSRNYRATHCRVFLPPGDLKGPYENLAGTPCEVQVASLLAHVWNEIEHDMGYKPHGGELSAAEQRYIEELAQLTVTGDAIIMKLIAAADEKLAEREGDFTDEHDFMARAGRMLSQPQLPAVEPRELYHALLGLGIRGPLSLATLMGEGWRRRGEQLITQLNAVLAAQGREYSLDPQDFLLALLLDNYSEQIVKSWPMQRRMPRRSVELAQLTLEIKAGKHRKML